MKNSEALATTSLFEIQTQEPEYAPGIKGFYSEPKEPGDYPGIVMIHEWWGLNDNIKDTAKKLAGQGYRVLAVDLFGKVATTPEDATAQVRSLDQTAALENLKTAVAFLREKGSLKIASLGWCFGGGQSLALSLSGEKLDATVLYYGTPLVTDEEKLKAITWPVLGIFGAKDQAIPVSSVNAFESSLNALHIENSITIYPNVGHAFANPSGANYAPAETKDAWDKTLAFLADHLK